MAPTISARFTVDLRGTAVDPDSITQRVGVEPTWVFRMGEPPRPGAPPAQVTSWTLRVERKGLEIEPVVAMLFDQLRRDWKAFVQLGREFPCDIGVTILSDMDLPTLVLSRAQVHDIAALNASFDIDPQLDSLKAG